MIRFKFNKKLLSILLIILFVGVCFTLGVLANSRVELIEYKYADAYYNNIALYSNNEMYVWGMSSEKMLIRDDVVDIAHNSERVFYLNSNNELYMVNGYYDFDEFTNKTYNEDDDILMLENVKSVSDNDAYLFFLVITNDNKLYAIGRDNSDYSLLGGLELVDTIDYTDIYYIADNVKDFKLFDSNSLIYRDYDNNLYAIGRNYFGQKINEGNYLSAPVNILDDVVEYESKYALDSKGNLYTFISTLAEPSLVISNVVEFNVYEYNMELLWVKMTDNKDYFVRYDAGEVISNIKKYEIDLSSDKEDEDYLYNHGYIVIDNVLYNVIFRDSKCYVRKWLDNVDSIRFSGYDNGYCILTNDNVLYGLNGECISGLTHFSSTEYNKLYKVMEGVKDISYINDKVLVMEDDTVWMYGENERNKFQDETITNSSIPLVVKNLPNVNDPISVYDIDLVTLDKNKFTIGATFDYYVNIFPYNASDKGVVWNSSNEEVATISNNGKITAIGVGSSIISVETIDGKIKEEYEITVYPDINGIEIINGDSLDLELYERVILTAKVLPDETLEQEVVWNAPEDGFYISDYSMGGRLPNNQRLIEVTKGGTYTVTVTTKNGLYSDTITINTVEKVNSISLKIDSDHFDGVGNAFIYLNENNKLQVDYGIYPETATNQNVTWESSNEDVASVSSTGLIEAKKVGRTTITIRSVDGNASRSFNVLVYDYNNNQMIGDINGDGSVDMLDLIKLRRYLAGLENDL